MERNKRKDRKVFWKRTKSAGNWRKPKIALKPHMIHTLSFDLYLQHSTCTRTKANASTFWLLYIPRPASDGRSQEWVRDMGVWQTYHQDKKLCLSTRCVTCWIVCKPPGSHPYNTLNTGYFSSWVPHSQSLRNVVACFRQTSKPNITQSVTWNHVLPSSHTTSPKSYSIWHSPFFLIACLHDIIPQVLCIRIRTLWAYNALEGNSWNTLNWIPQGHFHFLGWYFPRIFISLQKPFAEQEHRLQCWFYFQIHLSCTQPANLVRKFVPGQDKIQTSNSNSKS